MDPTRLSVLDPVGFKAASQAVEDAARGLQTLLEAALDETSSVSVLYGPVPLPFGECEVAFQVAWFGSETSAWPASRRASNIQTATEGLGRMALWLFEDYEEAASFVTELFNLEVPLPTVQ